MIIKINNFSHPNTAINVLTGGDVIKILDGALPVDVKSDVMINLLDDVIFDMEIAVVCVVISTMPMSCAVDILPDVVNDFLSSRVMSEVTIDIVSDTAVEVLVLTGVNINLLAIVKFALDFDIEAP